jgi:two-component system LytT family response regulator
MNNSIKTIIIDDEKLGRDLIKNYLQVFDNIEIVSECENGFDGLKSINENKPDLIFLDIQMPKLNGFEMLELMEEHPKIIFTTAYDQYALKAFEVNAIDYLLKPFSRDRFADALSKVLSKIGETEKSETPTPKFDILRTEEKLNRIVVKKNNKILVIPIDEINFIEAKDDYVSIVTNEGSFLKQNRMKYYEENLPDKFIRIHRSYICNLTQIKEIALLEKESHFAILKTGEKLSVSKNGYKRLKEIIR